MRQLGNKVASKQVELNTALSALQEVYADTGTGGTASGQDNAERALCTEAQSLDNRCMEVTCAYVCLTLFNAKPIRASQCAAMRVNLRVTLALLAEHMTASPIFTDKVEEMKAFAEEQEPPANNERTTETVQPLARVS